MSKPKRSLADIRKTMASVAEKEKNHVVWVNYEVIVTDSDTTEDEAEVSKSRELSNDEESDHTPIMNDSPPPSPKKLHLIDRKKRCNSFTRSQRKNEESMELKASFDSIVSEQERQNRMIGNLMSDNTHLKSQWIRYDPERQDIKQRDAINELKRDYENRLKRHKDETDEQIHRLAKLLNKTVKLFDETKDEIRRVKSENEELKEKYKKSKAKYNRAKKSAINNNL